MKDSLEMAFKIYSLLVVRGCSWNTSSRLVVALGLQVASKFFLFVRVGLSDWVLIFLSRVVWVRLDGPCWSGVPSSRLPRQTYRHGSPAHASLTHSHGLRRVERAR